MNVYIRIEVLSRELQGRLLLALVAAERGHRVVLGKHNGARMLGEKGFPGYPPGVWHDKSLGHSDPKTEMKKILISRGWGITAQDEEHGLVTETFGEDMLSRFPDEGFEYNHLLFAWGEFDSEGLLALRPARRGQIIQTGSPRADLWRPDMAGAHGRERVNAVTEGRPFVLMNPIGGWNPGDPESVFGIDGTSMDDERIARFATGLRLMSRFIAAADSVASSHPDLLVVLRPHPAAPLDMWSKATDKCHPNVILSRDARLTPWLRAADAVITNGSTVAFEALLVGTPHIVYAPDGHFEYDAVTHRIGRAATSPEELSRAIAAVAGTTSREQWFSPEMRALVQHRFAALDGRLAADRIVDEWERLGERLSLSSARPWKSSVLRKRARAALTGRLQSSSGDSRPGVPRNNPEKPSSANTAPEQRHRRWKVPKEVYLAKFPPLSAEDIQEFHQGLIQTTGRFTRVRINILHDQLMLVERA